MTNNEQIFYHGEFIFKEGDLSQEIYLIKSGCIQLFQIHHGREVEIAKLYPGDIFGEMAILGQTYRSATARVVDNAIINVIPQEMIQSTLANNPIWVNALIKVLTGRLKDMTKKYGEQISDYHPFKYLNTIINTKINNGEKPEKLANEFHEMLLEETYDNTMNMVELISKKHSASSVTKQGVEQVLSQLNKIVNSKIASGTSTEKIAIELIKILLNPEYKRLLMVIQLMQPNKR